MRRRVSMWVVIALVGALAATSAAVVILATDGGGDRTVSHPIMQSEEHGPWQMPVMGEGGRGWDDGRGSLLLPWMLFAIATGTSVGLLIAWSPWRSTPAPVLAGGGAPVTPEPDAMAASPVGVTAPVEMTAAQFAESVTEASAPEVGDVADAAAAETTAEIKSTEHGDGETA